MNRQPKVECRHCKNVLDWNYRGSHKLFHPLANDQRFRYCTADPKIIKDYITGQIKESYRTCTRYNAYGDCEKFEPQKKTKQPRNGGTRISAFIKRKLNRLKQIMFTKEK